MSPSEIIYIASHLVRDLSSNYVDVVEIKKPHSIEYAVNLAKVVSKLSPLIGNMIEFTTVDLLNAYDWEYQGKWMRQDPGFPDATFLSKSIVPNPGIEIKAWFPFATEITARFKESQNIFVENPYINVALIAWLPENVIWGKPHILDTLVVSGESVAKARDAHYHRPPSYIVMEPEDTRERTGNLQQTNTNGFKFQADKSDIKNATEYVMSMGEQFLKYSPAKEYQEKVRRLQSLYTYRLDTNYAKIDRIEHKEIEDFKEYILNMKFHGKRIKEWAKILSGCVPEDKLRKEIETLFEYRI
ncbi:hypothetical protein [Alistipes putredinis]|uniref:hypothetical protein n=1 Tax=Alistipes putredinis TaxID=28117 RepID=UPI0039678A76